VQGMAVNTGSRDWPSVDDGWNTVSVPSMVNTNSFLVPSTLRSTPTSPPPRFRIGSTESVFYIVACHSSIYQTRYIHPRINCGTSMRSASFPRCIALLVHVK
jgi:hypothetical protein